MQRKTKPMFPNETSAFAFYTEGTPQYFYQKKQ